MKILLIGHSGSGKSTLAAALARRYGEECLNLDRVHWLPGWKERDRESSRAIVKEFLDGHAGWIIDGNYSSLWEKRRLEEADLIIEMLFPPLICLIRAWKRYRHFKGQSRPDMTEGCPEKLDREFARWILKDGRNKAKLQHYREIRQRYPEKTVVIRNQRELDAFMKDRGIETK